VATPRASSTASSATLSRNGLYFAEMSIGQLRSDSSPRSKSFLIRLLARCIKAVSKKCLCINWRALARRLSRREGRDFSATPDPIYFFPHFVSSTSPIVPPEIVSPSTGLPRKMILSPACNPSDHRERKSYVCERVHKLRPHQASCLRYETQFCRLARPR
jgi:hypothetical protein